MRLDKHGYPMLPITGAYCDRIMASEDAEKTFRYSVRAAFHFSVGFTSKGHDRMMSPDQIVTVLAQLGGVARDAGVSEEAVREVIKVASDFLAATVL